MKRLIGFLGVVLLLSACRGNPTAAPSITSTPSAAPGISISAPLSSSTVLPSPSVTPLSPSVTHTPRPAANGTRLPSPSTTRTPRPTPTASSAPTQTLIPSATPTFDVASAVTRTPALPAVCPVENPGLALDLTAEFAKPWSHPEQAILEFLNQGGSRQAVRSAYQLGYSDPEQHILESDLTGDGMPELITGDAGFYIFGCDQGIYRTLPVEEINYRQDFEYDAVYLWGAKDLNLDGLPEMIVEYWFLAATAVRQYLRVYAWDGSSFVNLAYQNLYGHEQKYLDVQYFSAITFEDADQNGTPDLVIQIGIPGHMDTYAHGPWREETHVYIWNGKAVVLGWIDLAPPEYRFQAVQDGDRLALAGKFDQALDLYQQAIFSDQLEWWSAARRENYVDNLRAQYERAPTPTLPAPDPNEYPHLAAYARFRIMLLHLRRGYLPEAQTVYDTLQARFPLGQPGHAFAELAQAFWEQYQASQDMGQACGKAIAYAAAHADSLAYLGSWHHGFQSRTYQPEDVCPFK
jgi:hypothetical protein